MDIEELQKKCKKWQKRLGLSDWDITVAFKDARDVQNSDGMCTITAELQRACIRLKKMGDRVESEPLESDVELSLVHELVHIRLWAIDPEDTEGALHTCREQAVEWIAKGLLAADRGDK